MLMALSPLVSPQHSQNVYKSLENSTDQLVRTALIGH